MGVATGCGCKEVYRFPQTTYPYSSCICSFYSSIPTFCSFKKMFLEEKLEEEERRMPNRDFFYSARCVRKLRYYSDVTGIYIILYIHSFDWKSVVEDDGGV